MKNKESKSDRLLKKCQEHIGEWVCIYCNSDSGQPAAISRVLREKGYLLEETQPGTYSKQMYCPHCGKKRSHIKLLSAEPANEKNRNTMSKKDRERIISCLGKRDAYTGASIKSSTPEIDHKTPFSRLEKDIDISNISNDEIPNHFQILTRANNLLKEKACKKCIKNGQRSPHMGINYWYEGNETYNGTCIGCGWHDGINWRAKLNNDLEKKNALIKAYQKYNLFLEEQLTNAYTYANLHGYNCSESDILQGETLRENIREIFYKEI